MTPTRRVMGLAGVATLAVSLVITIAPALAANGNANNGNANNGGNGNGGTVKVHDAATGLEAGEQGNEPWVCTFWVGFYASDPFESGAWQLLSWPPTGDGSVVASGTYDTSGDGVDMTATLDPGAGHYRFEWLSGGSGNAKSKTLWVSCEADATDEADPSDEASPSQEASPSVESSPSQDASPSEEASPSQEASPTDEASPSQEPSPTEESSPSQEATPTAPSDDASPSAQPQPSNVEAPASNEPTPSIPEQDVEHGSPAPTDAVAGDQAPIIGGGGEPTLPDTATDSPPSGVLATIGILLIIAAHVGTRRERQLPAA